MAMAMYRLGRMMMAVHDSAPPTDDEWARWVALVHAPASPELRLLIETTGQGGPNAKQRKALADATLGLDVRAAILSDSMAVRGVITALAWLGLAQRAFVPGDHRGAADYLGLSAQEGAKLIEALPSLRREVGRPNVQVSR
ncbi:MAG TPA: hypothetical protein VJU61_22805 [Polyangiaceae bacterium]|nr:hypothetical protein [Polyangiaceae bacterium]